MHFEILVEDKSGEVFLSYILQKIIISPNTFRIHSYRGIGRIPKNLNPRSDPSKRILLQSLPQILQGYGHTFTNTTSDYQQVVVIICDLDKRCRHDFRNELLDILNKCNPKPNALFCIAVEEGEAWLLGDIAAIKHAYSNAKDNILMKYKNDSICDTWECLADAIYKGGSRSLSSKGYQAIGIEKSKWATQICPHMDINNNKSQSFNYLKRKLEELIRH